MSLFSFLKRNKESYSLVFNIGSGSVSGGVIRFTEKPGENVIHYAKEEIPFQQEVTVSKHLQFMKSALTSLAGRIQKESVAGLKIDRVFYFFSSPWSISQTRIIRIKEPIAFKVTESYLNRVIDEQEKQFQTEIAQVGQIIEKKIIQLKINGYVVENTFNKLTKDLEIAVFFTAVPAEILQTVEDAVTKVLHLKNVWCHSLALATFSIIRNLFPQKEDFIHMDISEEITDISIIKDGVAISNASVPFGRHHFIRALSDIQNVTEEIADSQIRIHGARINDELGGLKLAVEMDGAGSDWLAKITEVLNGFKNKMYVPDTIYLTVSDDLTTFLKEKLLKQDFKVAQLDNKKLRSAVLFDDIIFKMELMFLDNLYKI